MNEIALDKLTNKKLLIRNSILSLVIQGLPITIAVFTIPIIMRWLGTDLFSIASLIWAVIGYSSLLDLGLGHALTQLVSRKLGAGDIEDLPDIIWTALSAILVLGVIAGFLVYLATPFIITDMLKIPQIYKYDTFRSFYLLSVTIPFLIMTISIASILESFQKFSIIVMLRVPVILCNFIGPLIALAISKSLFSVVVVVVIGRAISFAAHLLVCYKLLDFNKKKINLDFGYIKPLFNFGSWITVSNIINPFMLYLDRFFIAGMVSATVVAYYTTPYDLLNKLWFIPHAIMNVIFPAFSAEFAKNKAKTRHLFFESLKYIFLALIIPVLILFFFSKLGLTLWLDAKFANESYRIAQLLVIGIFIYSLNQPAYNLVQASGRSDIPAKFQLLELPVYLGLLWLLIKMYGMPGAALAWVIRITVDGILLNTAALKLMKR